METITKTFELQVDKLPLGYTVRLNDENGCVLRICQIPAEVIEKGELIDVIYPKKTKYDYHPIREIVHGKDSFDSKEK